LVPFPIKPPVVKVPVIVALVAVKSPALVTLNFALEGESAPAQIAKLTF
jgi:hypothetical protein